MLLGLSNIAYRHIKEKLLTGSFPGGSMLSETTLAKEIGISRTPIREAIAQLEREGLLNQIPRYGTFVRVLDRDEVAELYEFRAELEGFAAEQAAAHLTPRFRAELQQHCRRMMAILRDIRAGLLRGEPPESSTLSEKWMLEDASFHTAIIRAGGNRWAAKVAGDMRLMVQIFGHWHEIPGRDCLANWARTWREHRRLLRALSHGRGGEARRIMVDHIRKGKIQALEYYDWTQRQRSHPTEKLSDALRQHLRNLERYALISHRQSNPRRRVTKSS